MPEENNNNYQFNGEGSVVSLREADPVQCCLSGESGIFSMETCAGNPLRTQVGLCPLFMSERCARNWDGYCDIYLKEQSQNDPNGKKVMEFLKDTLSHKFCRTLDVPGSYCYTRCETFNPTSPNSAQICRTVGDVVYRPSNKQYNLDTNFNWSGKLNTAEPIKFTGCKKTCDVFPAQGITDDDRVVNECLDRGIGMDIISNLAQNLVASKTPVANKRLKQYIDYYVIGSTNAELTPGFSSMGASGLVSTKPISIPTDSNYVAPNATYLIQQNIGNFPPNPTANAQVDPQATVSQGSAPVVEPFGFRRHYQQPQISFNGGIAPAPEAPTVNVTTSPKSKMLPTIIVGSLVIAVLAVMFMLIRRK